MAVPRNHRTLGPLVFVGLLVYVMTLAVYNNPEAIAPSLSEVLRL